MAETEDLTDFNVIETCKENIQPIPGGRSAKQLSSVLSPLAAKKSPPLSEIHSSKEAKRQEYEQELASIAEADDPLDIYDRYVKWTTDTYPSAQGTNESNLLPLLERATKAFLTSSHYKNDPRYIKLWLLYIRLFSDSPRETYAFLAKHNIGENLALFYEEFAAWLENAGRWAQAEEVYLKGIDREARPQERLIRKFGEFQHRRETKGSTQDGPTSPAMPKVRAALAAKLDPFASAAEEADPQARDRAAAAAAPKVNKPGRSKMSIFADGEEPPKPGSSDSNLGWDSIGSLKERRKENTHEAKPWVGETLQGGRRAVSGPKMMVFKDQSLGTNNDMHDESSQSQLQYSINPKTGRKECVFANLELVYPSGNAESGYEFCFEELRAMKRGLMDLTGRVTKVKKQKVMKVEIEPRPVTPPDTSISPKNSKVSSARKLDIFQDTQTSKVPVKMPVFDDNEVPDAHDHSSTRASQSIPVYDENGQPQLDTDTAAKAARRKMRKEEKANRTRKIAVMEVKAEPQTIQANLNSPSGPKIKRKRAGEATMTLHTKEAMDEVYDLFNQTLTKVTDDAAEDTQSQIDSDDDDDDDDDDDYTSAGESTTTGRFSVATSEAGDETQADFATATNTNVSVGDSTNNSGWSEFTEVKQLPEQHDSENEFEIVAHAEVDTQEEVLTPTSPTPDERQLEDPLEVETMEAPEESAMGRRGFSYRSRQLPFMTPIVEKTESSLGAMTALAEKEYFNAKTPSRQNNVKIQQVQGAELWSSPFQPNAEEDKENAKVSQPEFIKPAKVDEGKIQPLNVKENVREKPKGPIIKDAQCNPIDESIREAILSQIQPPLASYTGFLDRRGQIAAQGTEIRKYTKAVKCKGEKTMGLTAPPKLTLEGSSRQYYVRRELGKGAFAPVYLVDSQQLLAADDENDENKPTARMGQGDFGVRRGDQEAVKMEEPPSAWEFYIIRQAKRRLGVSRPSESIVEAYEMHLYEDECFLVEEFRNQGTLLDLVNVCRGEGSVMDEQLAMFFTVELFRTVEALHAKGLIHGDLKADNILVRLDNSETEWSPQYHRSGTNGWSNKGIAVIDFGRGIDMKAFKPDVQFIADWKTSEADCAEMREMRPWTYQVDYHGLAGIIHSMLFGKYLETVAERGASLGAGATKTYKVRENLKRYWQTEIWGDVFGLLLNPLMHLEGEEGRKLPVLSGMKGQRERMEMYLEANCEKGTGLKAGLRRMENAIRERRK